MPAPDAPPGPEPILNLDTLVRRPCIAIDGVRFEILSAEEISVIDSHRFGIWGRRIDELAGVAGAQAEAELQELIGLVARKVLVGVPDAVFEKLSGAHKWAVVDVFTGLLLGNRLGVAGAMQRAAGPGIETLMGGATDPGPTGARSSPASSGSTAASRDGGWIGRLLRWSGPT